MTDINFGRLEELPLREAWKHEALEFTPWLAKNLDRLSEAIGIPLELTGTEVAVETFSADILANDTEDGSLVLIENQLETTDHTHLGQIMTYLAGLGAQHVVWIAPQFREPHLSAIRWLNENTAHNFSFFAVKARVVRIGDSPYAPIFEVVEKPNDWDRSLMRTRQAATSGGGAHSETREKFWAYYLKRYPDAGEEGIKLQRGWNCYTALMDGDIRISVWLGADRCGIYVRGGWGDRKYEAQKHLEGHLLELREKLGCELSDSESHVMGEGLTLSYHDEANWNTIVDWMEERRKAYKAAIISVLGLEG